MLKKDLITLVQQLRTENSTLRTQLGAARTTTDDAVRTRINAIKRLAHRHPERRSFTPSEVAEEIACSA